METTSSQLNSQVEGKRGQQDMERRDLINVFVCPDGHAPKSVRL